MKIFINTVKYLSLVVFVYFTYLFVSFTFFGEEISKFSISILIIIVALEGLRGFLTTNYAEDDE